MASYDLSASLLAPDADVETHTDADTPRPLYDAFMDAP